MEALDLAQKAVDDRKKIASLVGILQNTTLYVAHVLDSLKVTFDGKWIVNGREVSQNQLKLTIFEKYQHDIATVGKDNITAHLSNEMLKMGLTEARRAHVTAHREAIFSKVAYDPFADGAGWDSLSKILSGSTEYGDVFRQFVWGVKNKLSGNIAIDGVFPVIYGKQQGIGKSYACLLITKCLGDLATSADVNTIVDTKNISILSDYAVVICDEMSGMGKSEIEALKSIVTAKSKTVRRLYESDTENVTIVASFIGSSNKSVSEIIKDSSGNRRFLEIPCKSTIDIKAMESLPFQEMWQSVNEKKAGGYWTENLHNIKNRSNVRAQQINMNSIEAFLNENGFEPGEVFVDAASLSGQYARYCMSLNIAKPSPWASFNLVASNLGFKCSTSGMYVKEKK